MFEKRAQTPLVRINALAERFGVPNMLVKDESKNTFGTWKDRRLRPIVDQVRKERPDKVVLITAGNAAYSLARMLEGDGTKVAAIIDYSVAPRIKKRLRETCFQIVETDLDRKRLSLEERIALVRLSKDEHIIDVTENQSAGYETIVDEVAGENPAAIVVPVGQGEGFDGICRGVIRNGLDSVVVGVLPLSQEDTIADKLKSRHTHHVRNIVASMQMLPKGHSQMCAVDESTLAKAYAIARDYVDCEPSSAIVFPVGPSLRELGLIGSDKKIVFVNSGKGL